MWGLGWIPLGGYCDIAGMVDETKTEADLEETPQPWEYRTKPAWQRLFILSGGVLVNFLSALLLYACIFAHWGKDDVPLRSANLGYEYHQVMLDEGFQNGDIIYAIDGRDMYEIADATQALLLDNPRSVTVLRGDSLVDIQMSGHLTERVNDQRVKQLMGVRMPFVVKATQTGMGGEKAGLQEGDSLVGVGGVPMATYGEISSTLALYAGDTVGIDFYRHGELRHITAEISSDGLLGVRLESDITKLFSDYRHIDYNFFQAIPAGISYGWQTLVTYVTSLKVLFSPGGAKSLGGFGTMASIFPETWDWLVFWSTTALLALVLAFMNIIPIPGLDGGHLLFTLWEVITRRKPSDKFLTVAQNIGMFLLIALMVLANGNDLWRWISSRF